MAGPYALTRGIPDTFDQALIGGDGRPPDVARARIQHDEYSRRLTEAGYQVEELVADPSHPDCVFVEDTAVLIGSTVVLTRPGAASRRGEVEAVAQALSRHFPTMAEIGAPGNLDGGDVFSMSGTVYVGRSRRSNDVAIGQLRSHAVEHGLRLVAVEVRQALHLKSAVLPVGPETVVVTPGSIDEEALAGLEVIHVDPTERFRFSALPLGEQVLVTSSSPRTNEVVAARGIAVAPIDVSEIQAADGGLTCMSILIPRAG